MKSYCETCRTERSLVMRRVQVEDWKTVYMVMTACPHQTPATEPFNCTHHHPDIPSGWANWYPWAKTMQQTHRQVQCDECHGWHIWIPVIENEKEDK